MNDYSQATAALKRLIKINMLQHIKGEYVYDAVGLFHLDMDARENLKCDFVKPQMPDYPEFLAALDADYEDIIMPFEQRASAKMHELESDIALDFIQSL